MTLVDFAEGWREEFEERLRQKGEEGRLWQSD